MDLMYSLNFPECNHRVVCTWLCSELYQACSLFWKTMSPLGTCACEPCVTTQQLSPPAYVHSVSGQCYPEEQPSDYFILPSRVDMPMHLYEIHRLCELFSFIPLFLFCSTLKELCYL